MTEFDDRLRTLEELPFVEAVEVRDEPQDGKNRADAEILIETPNGTVRLLAEIKRTHLTHAIVDAFVARALAVPDRNWSLAARGIQCSICYTDTNETRSDSAPI